jgi:hypothetical protein
MEDVKHYNKCKLFKEFVEQFWCKEKWGSTYGDFKKNNDDITLWASEHELGNIYIYDWYGCNIHGIFCATLDEYLYDVDQYSTT